MPTELTVEECPSGTMREADRAFCILGKTATLEAGKSADFAVWDIDCPAELVDRIGFYPVHTRFLREEEISK